MSSLYPTPSVDGSSGDTGGQQVSAYSLYAPNPSKSQQVYAHAGYRNFMAAGAVRNLCNEQAARNRQLIIDKANRILKSKKVSDWPGGKKVIEEDVSSRKNTRFAAVKEEVEAEERSHLSALKCVVALNTTARDQFSRAGYSNDFPLHTLAGLDQSQVHVDATNASTLFGDLLESELSRLSGASVTPWRDCTLTQAPIYAHDPKVRIRLSNVDSDLQSANIDGDEALNRYREVLNDCVPDSSAIGPPDRIFLDYGSNPNEDLSAIFKDVYEQRKPWQGMVTSADLNSQDQPSRLDDGIVPAWTLCNLETAKDQWMLNAFRISQAVAGSKSAWAEEPQPSKDLDPEADCLSRMIDTLHSTAAFCLEQAGYSGRAGVGELCQLAALTCDRDDPEAGRSFMASLEQRIKDIPSIPDFLISRPALLHLRSVDSEFDSKVKESMDSGSFKKSDKLLVKAMREAYNDHTFEPSQYTPPSAIFESHTSFDAIKEAVTGLYRPPQINKSISKTPESTAAEQPTGTGVKGTRQRRRCKLQGGSAAR